MPVAAALLGVVIGAVIGGLGGGGGVLAVPALFYLLGQTAQDATTGSVVIVGVTAAAGAAARLGGSRISWRTAIAFGVVGIPATQVGTRLNQAVDQSVLLLAFAVTTLVAASAMLLDSRRGAPGPGAATAAQDGGTSSPAALVTGTRPVVLAVEVVVCAALVGFLTGFLGVGGGFLVVPALVVVLRTPMRQAIGTSLVIIAMNSASSLTSRLGDLHLDWWVIAPFTVAAIAGSFAGKRVADRLTGRTLTTAFAVMLVLVGLFVGAQSLLSL